MRYLTSAFLCLAIISILGADIATDSDSADVTLTIEQYCYMEFDDDDSEAAGWVMRDGAGTWTGGELTVSISEQ